MKTANPPSRDSAAMTASAVVADAVCKTYRVYATAGDRLRELVFRRPRHREFHALRDVSFALPRGAALGLIGENGAGKSTLLKIVAGTTQASSGTIVRDGAVASILELGMGFHADFTGRENARMNAALLGLNGPEIRRRLPEIRDFPELGEFFDRPVRTYSSGMVLPLALPVATRAARAARAQPGRRGGGRWGERSARAGWWWWRRDPTLGSLPGRQAPE